MEQTAFELASSLRALFSGLVAGNVKAEGIREIQQHGRFKIKGDKKIMQALDNLLDSFVAQKRMKINADAYQPCYDIVD